MQNSIVDNNTYNLIMALSKSLEAIEVYGKYAQDGNRQLWEQLSQKARESAQMLQQELMRTMGQQSGQFVAGTQGSTTENMYARASEATGTPGANQANQSQSQFSGTNPDPRYNQPR